ncbi:MAG: phage portal protein [Caldilinea sp. CFX5]|nr:phage portal protein [Caldilinea sp. CFX5]
MGMLSRLFELSDERRGVTLSDALMTTLRGLIRGDGPVTPSSAMQIAAVYACVRVIAEALASLPLIFYERTGRSKQRAMAHPLYTLLHDLPNPEHTSIEMRMLLQGHLLTWGNAYAQIVWNRRAQVLELWPLRPDCMTVERRLDDLTLRYHYSSLEYGSVEFQWYEILHLRGMGFDGLLGYSPIRLMERSLGLANKLEAYSDKFYENGARPGMLLKHPGKLSQPAYQRLLSSWEARHQGVENAHRVAILEEGLDVAEVGIPPQDAQFLETAKFQRSQIASIFRVPPHMIGDLERATFSNIEQQSIEFVTFTLGPWLGIWEQAIYRDLLSPAERERYFAEFLVDGLLRGDTASRYQAYQSAITTGWMAPNEAREKENLNPLEGGDTLLQPLNMAPAGDGSNGSDGSNTADPTKPTDGAGKREWRGDDGAVDEEAQRRDGLLAAKVALHSAMRPLFQDVSKRVIRREVADIRRAVEKHLRKRSLADFREWLRQFYDEFPAVVRDAFDALLNSYAGQAMTAAAGELGKDDAGVNDELRKFIEDYLVALANGHVAASRRQLEALINDAQADGADPAEYIEQRVTGWEESRPEAMARRQAVEAGNALAIASYTILGVQYLRWLATGASCNACRSLNGRVVGIAGFFVQGGEYLDGGDQGLMLVRRNARHGPIHDGCDCVVMAG